MFEVWLSMEFYGPIIVMQQILEMLKIQECGS